MVCVYGLRYLCSWYIMCTVYFFLYDVQPTSPRSFRDADDEVFFDFISGAPATTPASLPAIKEDDEIDVVDAAQYVCQTTPSSHFGVALKRRAFEKRSEAMYWNDLRGVRLKGGTFLRLKNGNVLCRFSASSVVEFICTWKDLVLRTQGFGSRFFNLQVWWF